MRKLVFVVLAAITLTAFVSCKNGGIDTPNNENDSIVDTVMTDSTVIDSIIADSICE